MCKMFDSNGASSFVSEVGASGGVGVGSVGSVAVVVCVVGSSSLLSSCRVHEGVLFFDLTSPLA